MGKKFITCTLLIISAVLCCKREVLADAEGAQIAEGVYIENMDMSGKTYQEAAQMLSEYVTRLSEQMVYCENEEAVLMFSLADAGLYADIENAVSSALSVGRNGGWFKRWQDKRSAKKESVHIALHFSCDRGRLEDVLTSKAADIHREPEDAQLVRKNGQFIISKSSNGQSLDVVQMTDAIVHSVENGWDGGDIHIPLVVTVTAPAHTEAEFADVRDLLGAYTTSFAGSAQGRVTNIKNAAAKLENHVVYPGEEFSFLALMVPFTYENGYAMAGTYVNGKSVDGMGGGICQVSSTLYNAVLRAELTVTSRSNHMMTVGYVPLGADATVANPNVDFKFRNDLETPVLIESYTYGTSIYINIYGAETRPAGREVSFVTVTEQVIQPGADVITYDASLPASYREVTQRAHTGYVAAFYKNVYENGQLISQTLVNRSKYGAYPNYVIQGTQSQ